MVGNAYRLAGKTLKFGRGQIVRTDNILGGLPDFPHAFMVGRELAAAIGMRSVYFRLIYGYPKIRVLP